MRVESNKKAIDAAFIAGMAIAWAGYYLASDRAVSYTGSAFLAGMLLRAAAFVFLTVYVAAKGKFKALFRQGRVTLILLVIGILGFLLDAFANTGFKYGSVGTGTVLLKTDILMANVASALFFGEKLKFSDWIATAVMLGGTILVLGVDLSSFTFNWYDLFFIASALSVTANAFVIKQTQISLGADSDIIAYYNNFVVLILFTVSALIAGDHAALTDGSFDWKFWLIAAGGGLAQTLIYIFYYRNLKRHPVWKIKMYLLFVPIISCVVGAAAFGEEFGAMKGAGIAAVLCGALIIIMRDKISFGKLDKLARSERYERKIGG